MSPRLERRRPARPRTGRSSSATRESPRGKQERVRASFTRKVEVLEAWVRDGLPMGQYWPRGPVELASWCDETLGVSAWSKRNIASPNGPYPELRRRFDEAARALGRKPASKPEREQLRRETITDLKAQTRALSEQIVGLLDRLQEVTDDLTRERQLRREKEMELAKLVPLQAVRGGPRG